MEPTVIQYLLSQLNKLGVNDIFGVAGDYSFPINDAICEHEHIRWIGNCNELNAAYAADGYARIKGIAALATTFGVGELSAMNALAGSYAEYLPIFHLVGMPTSKTQMNQNPVHHTLGNGDFNVFYKMSQSINCAHTILTPDNCITEVERLINCALTERRPVYIGIPADYATSPIKIDRPYSLSINHPQSNQHSLKKAVDAILAKLESSKKSAVLTGILIRRFAVTDKVQSFIEKSNLPYATMMMDKGVISESNTNYMGSYHGYLANEHIRAYIESCDCILNIGALFSDVNTGFFTASINPDNRVNIMPDHVSIGSKHYPQVYIRDVLNVLEKQLPIYQYHHQAPTADKLGPPSLPKDPDISAEYLYARFESMFREDDHIFTDTGTPMMGLLFALLPKNAQYHSQTLWGSIGWSTAAAFGAALAAPQRRIILITGEGAHQLTAQEICQFARFGLKPIIFIINNDGYLFERLICKDPDAYYNDIAYWNYSQLPAALGCEDWYCQKVSRCDELDDAIRQAELHDNASYIEIITGKYVAPELAHRLRDSLDKLYSL